MHIHFLDPYIKGDSIIHHLDSRIKFVLVIGFILTTALTDFGDWPVFILLIALILSCEVLSEISLKFYFQRALLAIPFFLAALPIMFSTEGKIITSLPFGLTITEPGLVRFFSIALKSWISIQAAVLLSSTTQFPDILRAMRSVRLPKLLVGIIGLMWRYLFVMGDEALRLIRARQARSGESLNSEHKSGGKIAWRAKSTGGMAGSLFLRSLERSDRIYMAMVSRGYDGEVRILPQPRLSSNSWITLIVGIIIFTLLILIGIFI